jgi:hypothetical protein
VVSSIKERHGGDEREHLVRRSLHVVRERLTLGSELGIGPQHVE